MPHYIRLLRPPVLRLQAEGEAEPGKHALVHPYSNSHRPKFRKNTKQNELRSSSSKAAEARSSPVLLLDLTLTITTDLGDSFYSPSNSLSHCLLPLHVELYHGSLEALGAPASCTRLPRPGPNPSRNSDQQESAGENRYGMKRMRELASASLKWGSGNRVLACPAIPLRIADGLRPNELAEELKKSPASTCASGDGLWVRVHASPDLQASGGVNTLPTFDSSIESKKELDLLLSHRMPEVVSVWAQASLSDDKSSNIEKRVLRRFGLPVYEGRGTPGSQAGSREDRVLKVQAIRELCVWEEMGESIARHVWYVRVSLTVISFHTIKHGELLARDVCSLPNNYRDAALAFLAFLSASATADPSSYLAPSLSPPGSLKPLLYDLFHPPTSEKSSLVRILELGTGCGTVGLGLAKILSEYGVECRIELTDLPEAMAILATNIAQAEPELTGTVSVESRVLEWVSAQGAEKNENGTERADNDGIGMEMRGLGLAPDLVLVSDCTYNVGSFTNLVGTIAWAVGSKRKKSGSVSSQVGHPDHSTGRESKKLDVLVAMKRRHESEAVFFDMMDEAGFDVLGCEKVSLPDGGREEIGLEPETAEIWGFGWKGP